MLERKKKKNQKLLSDLVKPKKSTSVHQYVQWADFCMLSPSFLSALSPPYHLSVIRPVQLDLRLANRRE